MKPKQSYTIWFSQRTGSTLLNAALASTGIAGDPCEWLRFLDPNAIRQEDLERVWSMGTTSNGVFGIKTSLKPEWLEAFHQALQLPPTATGPRVWREAFPNGHHHIYMTRRNKVRLAVSWWRAIVSGEWHREQGAAPQEQDLSDKYDFEAIQHLIMASNLREAAMEAFFAEEGIVPLTLVYEDFIRDYEGTVRTVLSYLGLPADNATIAPPAYDRLADDAAEQWVQRFRRESQADWERAAW